MGKAGPGGGSDDATPTEMPTARKAGGRGERYKSMMKRISRNYVVASLIVVETVVLSSKR